MIKFTVPGIPKAQARHRMVRMGKFLRAYDPKESVDFKSGVKFFFLKSSGAELRLGPVTLRIEVFAKRPKKFDWKKYPDGKIVCITRPDADNYAKIIMDALNGVAWKDDSQIYFLWVEKNYHEKMGSPRMEITIE